MRLSFLSICGLLIIVRTILVAIKAQPRIKKAVETKGIIGDSRGNIDAIPPIKNETLDVISRQIFVSFFCPAKPSCFCRKRSFNDHIFKANESALNIVPAILKYKLKTGIFKTNAAMYPMKEIVDSVVTKRFE